MNRPSTRIGPVAAAAGLLLFSATGCFARVGSDISVPPDAAGTCAAQCSSIGLQMTAVAIMANNVGCVCQPPSRMGGQSQAGGTGATAGMATIMLEQEDQQRRQAAQQQTR